MRHLILLLFIAPLLYSCGTPLMKASMRGDIAEVNKLLAQGTPVDERASWDDTGSSEGSTALAAAASHGQTEAVKVLLDNGASVNAQSDFGWTALHQAVWSKAVGPVRVLLDAGADPNLLTSSGKSALDYAPEDDPVTILLLDKGAKNAKPPKLQGFTPGKPGKFKYQHMDHWGSLKAEGTYKVARYYCRWYDPTGSRKVCFRAEFPEDYDSELSRFPIGFEFFQPKKYPEYNSFRSRTRRMNKPRNWSPRWVAFEQSRIYVKHDFSSGEHTSTYIYCKKDSRKRKTKKCWGMTRTYPKGKNSSLEFPTADEFFTPNFSAFRRKTSPIIKPIDWYPQFQSD